MASHFGFVAAGAGSLKGNMRGPVRILVLGGTGDARNLAAQLAARPGVAVTLSLAGRTRDPVLPDCAVRVGGFGGAEGLARALADYDILVDATHPFARRVSANAEAASAATATPLVTLDRPPWQAVAGDRWIRVPDMAAAARALCPVPRRVFLAIGRQEAGAFRAAPSHAYLIRSVEPVAPDDLPPGAETLIARGPFAEADERALLLRHRIEIIVAKNSGGAATYGKIAGARALCLPVVLIDRDGRPGAAATVEEALDRLDALLAHRATSTGASAKRGV